MPGDFETNKNLSEGQGTLREMPAKSFMWFGWHSWFTRLHLQNQYRKRIGPQKKRKKKRFWGAQSDRGESFPLVEHWHVLIQTACKPETLCRELTFIFKLVMNNTFCFIPGDGQCFPGCLLHLYHTCCHLLFWDPDQNNRMMTATVHLPCD